MKTSISLYLFIICIISFQLPQIQAQQFTKITTGSIVNTASGSRSCNFLDVNNDNFQDILITNGKTGGENNMLYINNGDESFTLMEGPIVNDHTPTDGASCADYDNDGYVDVFAVNWYNEHNLNYKNVDGTTFEKIDAGVISTQSGYSETAAWGDYDNDGLVDLYVTNSAGGKRNFFYKNLGSGEFQSINNVSPATHSYFSRCVNWIDYDRDGDQDLYVTNENNQRNNLYRNDGDLVFTVITGDPIVSDNYNSISSSWADYDNDGDFDLFVANYQQKNQLFKNDGSGHFTLVSGPWESAADCSFGSSFADYDNDGDLDLFVTNGFCSNNLSNYLYINNGDGTFSKDFDEPMSTTAGGSFGCAWGDYNNDGFVDLVVANWQGETQPNYLFKNNGNGNHWLKLKLEGTESNRSAIGAIVKCKAVIDGVSTWITRDVSAQSGYCGQNSMVVHIGLDEATVVDSLQVVWPSGTIQNFNQIDINQYYTLKENEDLGLTITSVIDPVIYENKINVYPNPSNGKFTIEIDDLQGNNGVIQFFDTTGKQFLSKEIHIDTSKMSISIDDLGGQIPNGTYTVNIVVDQQLRFSSKVVIVD